MCICRCQKYVVVKWTKKLRRPNFNGDEMEVLIGGVERVSSFLTAHQYILGYLVPYNGEKVIKM